MTSISYWNNLIYIVARALKKMRPSSVKFSSVDRTSKIESGTMFYRSTMGRHSFCGYDCEIMDADIGNFVSIATGVIIGGGRHPMEWVGMSPVFYEGRDSVKAKFSEHKRALPKRIKIGHDVWIGRSAIILSGVEIGHGAVIGAGAIVTKSVPPYAVVAGNPARLIRYRFDESTMSRLLKSSWWDLADDELKSFGPYFNNPDEFLKIFERDHSNSGTTLTT